MEKKYGKENEPDVLCCKGSEEINQWKMELSEEAKKIEKYLKENGIRAKITDAMLKVYNSCSLEGEKKI